MATSFDQAQYEEEQGWRSALHENFYRRLGLDPEAVFSDEELRQACQIRLIWWEGKEKQVKSSSGFQNPLLSGVGPCVGEALKKLREAREVLTDPERRARYNDLLQKDQKQKWRQEITKLLSIALSDNVLTRLKKQKILEAARSAGIPDAVVEEIIADEMRASGAVFGQTPEDLSRGGAPEASEPPKLRADPTQFEFKGLRTGARMSGVITISNEGGGVLSGSVKVRGKKTWLVAPSTALDTTRHKQEVGFHVDTSGLSPGFSDLGILDIQTNGGVVVIGVQVSLEAPAEAIARFRALLTAVGAIMGALVGLVLYSFLPIGFRDSVLQVSAFAAIAAIVGVGVATKRAAVGCGVFIGIVILESLVKSGLISAGVLSAAYWGLVFLFLGILMSGSEFRARARGRRVPFLYAVVTACVVTLAIFGGNLLSSSAALNNPVAAPTTALVTHDDVDIRSSPSTPQVLDEEKRAPLPTQVCTDAQEVTLMQDFDNVGVRARRDCWSEEINATAFPFWIWNQVCPEKCGRVYMRWSSDGSVIHYDLREQRGVYRHKPEPWAPGVARFASSESLLECWIHVRAYSTEEEAEREIKRVREEVWNKDSCPGTAPQVARATTSAATSITTTSITTTTVATTTLAEMWGRVGEKKYPVCTGVSVNLEEGKEKFLNAQRECWIGPVYFPREANIRLETDVPVDFLKASQKTIFLCSKGVVVLGPLIISGEESFYLRSVGTRAASVTLLVRR